jgi:hypothetical protein
VSDKPWLAPAASTPASKSQLGRAIHSLATKLLTPGRRESSKLQLPSVSRFNYNQCPSIEDLGKRRIHQQNVAFSMLDDLIILPDPVQGQAELSPGSGSLLFGNES